MVVEQERDHVEICTPAGTGSSNGAVSATAFFIAGVARRACERGLGPLAEIGRILRKDDAVRRHRARHQFAAVAAAGAHIEHLHAGTRRGKSEERRRIAALVGVAVGVAAVGRRKQAGVIRRGLRRGAVEREGGDTGGRRDRRGDQKM